MGEKPLPPTHSHLGFLELPAELLHLDALDFVRSMQLLPLLLYVGIRLLPLFNFQLSVDEILTHLLKILRVLCLRTLQAPLQLIVQRVSLRRRGFVRVRIELAKRRAILLCWGFSSGGSKRCRTGRHLGRPSLLSEVDWQDCGILR